MQIRTGRLLASRQRCPRYFVLVNPGIQVFALIPDHVPYLHRIKIGFQRTTKKKVLDVTITNDFAEITGANDNGKNLQKSTIITIPLGRNFPNSYYRINFGESCTNDLCKIERLPAKAGRIVLRLKVAFGLKPAESLRLKPSQDHDSKSSYILKRSASLWHSM